MDSTKPWWQSIAVWGGVIAIAAQGYSLATGHVVSPDDQAALANTAVQVGGWVSSGVTIAGALAGIWGRLRATTTLVK
jgi:hypothetical protein